MFSFRAVRRRLFRTVSQTAVNYQKSSLSQRRAGTVHGGDRLLWVKINDDASRPDNFVPLASLDWQVHVYGNAIAEIRDLCAARKLPLHVFPWQPRMNMTGRWQDSIYLVRPDGYVAMTDPHHTAATVASYLDERGVLLMK